MFVESCISVILVLLFAAPAASAAKTDIVVLKNGDRITGEVKQMIAGQLKVSTDDAGTIYIEWDKIAQVTTALEYEVVASSGSRDVGRLAPDPTGMLQVIAADGTIKRLAFLDVVSFASIKAGFLERVDGSFDLGGSYTKSSGVGQMAIALDSVYRRPSYNVFTDFESTVTRDRSSPSTTRFTLRSGYTHFRSDGWIVTPFAFVERNADLGLSLRSLAAITVGTYLQQSSRSATLVAGGLAAGRERLIEGDTISNLDAVLSFATSYYRYDYPRSTVQLSALVFPELNRWGRVRANLDVNLKRELFRDFMAGVLLYDTYDSRPQVPDVSRNDIGVTISIGWIY